jgi:biotin carboxyl carrier protein
MESMKMELTIAAHRDGVVKRIPVEQGGQVENGMRLLELEDQPDSAG